MSFTSKTATEWQQFAALHGETPGEALARFLRERRESIAPEEVGISSHRGRRTPGLRREEVAFLADIGVKWYARLEAGKEIHPSAATLTSIAVALRLSTAELEYMLELAGLQHSFGEGAETKALPQTLSAFVRKSKGMAVTLCDRILTPMLWNALSEALCGHSRYETPVERNGLVRSLFDPEFIVFLGAEREKLIESAVGMFRLNYSSSSRSPIAAEVYQRVKGHPLFQRAWKQRVVSHALTREQITLRNHAVFGPLQVYAVDLSTPQRDDLFLRVLMPATRATAEKFEQLEQIGEAALAGASRTA